MRCSDVETNYIIEINLCSQRARLRVCLKISCKSNNRIEPTEIKSVSNHEPIKSQLQSSGGTLTNFRSEVVCTDIPYPCVYIALINVTSLKQAKRLPLPPRQYTTKDRISSANGVYWLLCNIDTRKSFQQEIQALTRHAISATHILQLIICFQDASPKLCKHF